MVKYDNKCFTYKYYNENGEHKLMNNIAYDKAAEVINDLITSKEFICDQTILNSLYMAMRKLQGFSDEDIKKLMR